jgi:alanine racemase
VLRPALRLRARVVRVERLRAGDSVSYGRHYVADRPTWVATLPVGHSDGYPREAVKGARVLVNGALYPVIGSVSASHTILSLGPFVGEEHRRWRLVIWRRWSGRCTGDSPNAVASVTGALCTMLMHLSVGLPGLWCRAGMRGGGGSPTAATHARPPARTTAPRAPTANIGCRA